jgi:hypothetical protein
MTTLDAAILQLDSAVRTERPRLSLLERLTLDAGRVLVLLGHRHELRRRARSARVTDDRVAARGAERALGILPR